MNELKNTNNILIHIGMFKSASTSIQNGFFEKLPKINYGCHMYNGQPEIQKAIQNIVLHDELRYNSEETAHIFNTIMNPDYPTIISSEAFVEGGGVMVPKYCMDRTIVAKRLKALFPEAKILLIIRNQYKILGSYFVEKLKANQLTTRAISFNRWMDINISLSKEDRMTIFNLIDYSEVIELYKSLFKSVKVVAFEDVVKDMTTFLKDDLCPYIGLDQEEAMKYFKNETLNTRHTSGELFYKNFIRKGIEFTQNKLGYPQRIIPLDKRKKIMQRVHNLTSLFKFGKISTNFTKEQQQYIYKYFKQSNADIAKEHDLDLKELGYPI